MKCAAAIKYMHYLQGLLYGTQTLSAMTLYVEFSPETTVNNEN